MSASPPKPRLALDTLLKVRQRLQEDLLLHFVHCRPEGPGFQDFLGTVQGFLPRKVRREVLEVSLRGLAGVELTEPVLTELSWRLAGNLPALERGRPVPPWRQQIKAEWVHLAILEARPAHRLINLAAQDHRLEGGQVIEQVERHGACLQLRVLSGGPAGRVFSAFWSWALIQHHKSILGFARFDREYLKGDPGARPQSPLRDLRELTRLRLLGLLESGEAGQELRFQEVADDAGCRRHNRQLHRQRRREDFSCPLGYLPREVPCYRCEAGYDRCPAGCHPVTYQLCLCEDCGQRAWTDPRFSSSQCVDCCHRSG